MGFDISYHPIREDEMEAWFFAPMKALREGDDSLIRRVAEERSKQQEKFFAEKYIDIMKTLASWDPNQPTEKGLLYGMAVISGFFTRYQYIRGTAYSFLLDRQPQMGEYCSSWRSFLPDWIPSPKHEKLTENYAAGVYMSPDQVKALLADYERNTKVRQILTDFFEGNLEVFLTALQDAKRTGSGLMEAAEVIEVEPLDLNRTVCYSDLFLCDPKGAYIYQDVAIAQIKAATGMSEEEIAKKVQEGKFTSQKTYVELDDTEQE